MDCHPQGFFVHGISQARILEWVTISFSRGSVVQLVKNLPVNAETQETWVQSLGWKDRLEEEMATHSSILVWKIPWTEEPGEAMAHGVTKSQTPLNIHRDRTHIPALTGGFFTTEPPGRPSVQFSRSAVSDSLRPHGLQHARPPCPSPAPGVYSNLCPLSQ